MKYTIQISGDDLFRFNMKHRYSSFQGMLQIVLYVLAVLLGIYSLILKTSSPAYSIMMFALAAFGIAEPFMLKKRCANAVKQHFATPIVYEFTEKGIALTQGEAHQTHAWKNVLKVTDTKSLILVYMDKIHALILPKNQLNGEAEELKRFIQEHRA